MPTHFFPLTILTQHFEDETYLSQALNFHEISRFNTNKDNSVFNARLNAEQTLKNAYANLLHTRIVPPNVEIKEFIIEVVPPKKSEAWREPVNLKIHVLQIEREDGYYEAFVPAFVISVITRKKAEFEAKIKREILSTLKRDGWTKSLKNLRWIERIENVTIETEEVAITLPTAKQRAIAEEKGEEEEKSVLKEVGTDLTKNNLNAAYESGKQVENLAEILRAKQKSSILLVGSAGVGKTAIFHELVRQRENLELKENQFWATSGSRLIAGQSGFGMWQERCQNLVKESKKRNAVIHLGNLIELLEVGKSTHSNQGIASFLRPKISRGEIVVVCECTPEQLPLLERRDPYLLGAFQQVKIEEPDKKTSLKILGSVAKEFEKDQATETEAIKIVDAIHRRFSTYSAFPGKPVRFLRNVFADLEHNEPLSPPKVYREFSNETGLPELLLNDEVPLNLGETEKFFGQRVVGQDEAVKLVTNLIATVKAKLTRPKKPIASLLFIGPTGVGKTEMVKSLAEFFFSDKGRMIRFDMSEFSNPLAVQRLIGGTGEAEGQLTAKVREQPFSVVLLDEFEKAHHSFFDLLLQILGEGRLTDSVGRVADFTNSIIVMTSNLGASEFQRGKSGFLHNSKERKTAVKHFDSAVREFLRPEIYNRLDRIVPFAPLDEKTVAKIAELEIEKLKKRDGLRFRPIKLELDKEALNYLIKTGYDILYGARPLKRTIERELLAPLSTELNLRSADEKLTISCSLKDSKISLEFVNETEAKKRSAVSVVLASQAERIAGLRRKMQSFLASYKLTELSDEIYQVVRIEAVQLRGKWVSEEDKFRIERKPKLEHFLKNLREFGEQINQKEDEILLEIYGKSSSENTKHIVEIEKNEKTFWKYLFELLSLQYQKPNEITLTFFSENSTCLFRLIRAYLACLKEFSGEIKQVLIFTSKKQADQKAEEKTLFDREVWRKEIADFATFFSGSPNDVVGILLKVEGNLALPRLGAENGIHNFQNGSRNDRVLAGSTEAEFEKFELPEDLIKRDSIKFQTERRIYDFGKMQMRDSVLDKKFSLENVDLKDVFVKANEENLNRLAESLIE